MLGEFEAKLRELIDDPTNLRPFVCEGSPLECKIFIVGINPATTLRRTFWQDWESGYGFRKARWFEHYKKERIAKGKCPISPTRQRIEWIVEAANPIKVLETNLYATSSAKASLLRKNDRDMKPFSLLYHTICPSVIFVHAKEQELREAEAFLNTPLIRNELVSVKTTWGMMQVMGTTDRLFDEVLWPENRARDTGRLLREACERKIVGNCDKA